MTMQKQKEINICKTLQPLLGKHENTIHVGRYAASRNSE
jgi:hypothetical protein